MMMEAKPSARRSRRARGGKPASSPYFIQPARGGAYTVLRKPAGNRVTPKVCGVMPSRAQAQALVRQLEQAESVVSDLFLEATDDGIEALEAVLEACRRSVTERAEHAGREGSQHGSAEPRRSRRRGRGGRSRPPEA